MTKPGLRFQVDSRLATLLSQEYASSEKALKELVDNAWDADAEQVFISLPRPMSDEPIVITDDGCGMTEEELRRHYLFIATDRRSRRGERTAGKNRLIKGRKGIGKFAGLMAASTMTLETRARGRLCGFTLRQEDLAKVDDIEQLDLAFRSEACDAELHGTTITLSGLVCTRAWRIRMPTNCARCCCRTMGGRTISDLRWMASNWPSMTCPAVTATA